MSLLTVHGMNDKYCTESVANVMGYTVMGYTVMDYTVMGYTVMG